MKNVHCLFINNFARSVCLSCLYWAMGFAIINVVWLAGSTISLSNYIMVMYFSLVLKIANLALSSPGSYSKLMRILSSLLRRISAWIFLLVIKHFPLALMKNAHFFVKKLSILLQIRSIAFVAIFIVLNAKNKFMILLAAKMLNSGLKCWIKDKFPSIGSKVIQKNAQNVVIRLKKVSAAVKFSVFAGKNSVFIVKMIGMKLIVWIKVLVRTLLLLKIPNKNNLLISLTAIKK